MKFLIFAVGLFYSVSSFAHVKWFSNYGFELAPLGLSEIANSPYFWPLFILSLTSLPFIVFLDRRAERSKTYGHINRFLDKYSGNSRLIMRIAMGAVLLMSWQADSIIAPEIPIPSPFWGWLELALAFFLIFKETTFLAGIGILGLYLVGIVNHGVFHMLDYMVYPAVGLFLVLTQLRNVRLRNLSLPVLYSGLGFSLCWVAFEKLVYPLWGITVLEQAPGITMGLDTAFFLQGAAFVEFTLGYLLIICLLQRPLAIVITLVFLVTTSFFGKTEIMGHTMLHGALLVFIVAGPGVYYQAPIKFHKSPWMRSLFAVVNFVILFFAMAFPYQKLATNAHAEFLRSQQNMTKSRIVAPANALVPEVKLSASADKYGGWNVHVQTKHFIFSPEHAGLGDIWGEGHAHLYLNGQKISRIYGDWFHINLPKGKSKLKLSLNSNNHEPYYAAGKEIADEIEIIEERNPTEGHTH